MNRKWKVYFWFYVVINLVGFLKYYGLAKADSIKFGDMLSLIISAVGGIGLYSYVYRKRIFSSKFWMVLFLLMAIDVIFGILISTTPLGGIIQLPDFLENSLPKNEYFLSELFGFALILPVYYAVYRLGQKELR